MDGGSADYCNEVAGKNPSQWGGCLETSAQDDH
jgi:hypothetical protein